MARPSARYIEELVAKWQPKLAKAFLEAFAKIRNRVKKAVLVRLIERGDIQGAILAVGLNPAALNEFSMVHAQAYAESGEATAEHVPASPDGNSPFPFLFALQAARSVAVLRERYVNLQQQVFDSAALAVRDAIVDGLDSGTSPGQIADRLIGYVDRTTRTRVGGIVGLGQGHAKWVASYANDLASDDPAILKRLLDRGLRDKRFDPVILRAIADGKVLTAAIQSRARTAYVSKMLFENARFVAGREAWRLIAAAQEEAWQQAIDSNTVRQDQIVRFWMTRRDERVRRTHRLIPGMNADGRGWREPFQTPSGPSMHAPHDFDPMCRCFERIEVVKPKV
ncbi:hypothetical protein [Methyloceanibacter caenitepidi]|uniref:Phage head morphogenesis domain-containing protein n=1 Tax=Methyloceanibacter caenitepidi TaxID=1384459 RepID=A0A0A8K727_9HYPH|nr:hypothetical protein [Methyloceanibacter caenitepidi]BAQ18312.1 hypothetical protein GL4_2879 [Methyloceanibacter caenitepidi]